MLKTNSVEDKIYNKNGKEKFKIFGKFDMVVAVGETKADAERIYKDKLIQFCDRIKNLIEDGKIFENEV
jgi:hypothetical protein